MRRENSNNGKDEKYRQPPPPPPPSRGLIDQYLLITTGSVPEVVDVSRLLLGERALVAGNSDLEINVAAPKTVPVSRPPSFSVPNLGHVPGVKVRLAEVALLSVQLAITNLSARKVHVLAPWTVPVPGSSLRSHSKAQIGAIVVQIFLLEVAVLLVTALPPGVVEVVTLGALPVSPGAKHGGSSLPDAEIRLSRVAALGVAGVPPAVVHVATGGTVPVSRHPSLRTSSGLLLTSPDELRPLLHPAVVSVAGEAAGEVHVATLRTVPVPRVLGHSHVVRHGPSPVH